ncbi:MAG: cytochrome C [Planctomycetes bacterium]|nr:cytochrome C [Planctomycetota bacterium]
MEHSKHIWRAALILLFLGTGFVGVRHFLIPKSFGQAGHYRYDSIFEYMAQEPNHGSRESCRKCHEEKFAETVKGRHAPVQCEVCHAPVSAHAKDDKKIADMPTNPNHKLCALCHQKLDSRPKGFPQVDLRRHLAGGGRTVAATIPDAACFECHSAHEPSPLRGER